MAPIPSFDLSEQHRTLSDEIQEALERVFSRGQFILGEEVAAFEREVAAFTNVREAVACGSGTDALHLALRAAGVGAGDEVVTSAFSFIAGAEAVLYVGATPVFADVDPASLTLNPASVESALSPKTRAIVAVHLYGYPADVGELATLAEQHNLALIEDCAQAFGARRDGRCAGSTSLAGCHSFFPTKNLGGCGDGGMVTTDDPDVARRLRLLRNHGSLSGYAHEIVGYNSRLDEIQAAILRVKLKHVERFNRRRRELAALYTDALKTQVQTPECDAQSDAKCEHVFNQYTILSERRDEIAAALDAAQIGSRVYYPVPLTEQPSLRGVSRAVACPRSEHAARRCLSLPMFPELAAKDVERVAAVVTEALSRPRR